MSFVLQTSVNDLRRKLRDPMGLLIWLGMPIVIGGMIQLAFGGSGDGGGPQAHVLVVDQDDSVLSGLLLGAMGQQQGQRLPFKAEAVDLEEGRARIEDGDASALLIIPEGFGDALLLDEPCTLQLVKNPAQRILPGMVEEAVTLLVEAVFYLHRVFGEPLRAMQVDPPEATHTLPDEEVARISITINRIMERLGDLVFPPVIRLTFDIEKDEGSGTDFGTLFLPSMLFMMLFFLAQGLSEDVWVEKHKGTLRRALTTPHRAGAFLAGKLLTAVVIVGVVSLFGFAVAELAFGLEVANLPLAVAWATLAGALLTVFMLLLQLHARSQRGGSLLAGLVMFPLLMIGGSFFPFEAMPEWMASIGKWTPNGWALMQLKAIIGGTIEPGVFAVSFLGIVAASAVLFLVSTRRMAGAFATQ